MIHGDVLGERARLTPDKTALVFVPTGQRLSYRELDLRARRTAAALLGLGLRPGDRVGLLAHNRIEFLDVFFAAGSSGLIVVPLGTRLTASELAYIVRDAGLSALVYDGAFAETVRELHGQGILPRLVPLDAGEAPRLKALVASVQEAPPSGPVPDPESPFALLYTSGTTGRPKGVIVPHRMVAWNAYNTALCWQLREEDVSPVFTPLYHAGGLGAFLLPIFAIGGTVVLHAAFDAAEIWRTIGQEKCTVVLGVPTIWKLLLEAPAFESAELGSVRWFISGGAPLPLYLIEAYQRRGVTFKQGYGLTEVGVNCFAMTAEEAARKKGSIGKPMMFTRARAVGPDGREVPSGEVGELWLQGPTWPRATGTIPRPRRRPWMATGSSTRGIW
jgi:fatty-acyl-CoA synthase